MRKLALNPEVLQVSSFNTATEGGERLRGTVRANETLNYQDCGWYAATQNGAVGCDNQTVPTYGYSCGVTCSPTFQFCGNPGSTGYLSCA